MDFLLSTHDWYIKKTNKQSVLECSDIAGKKKQISRCSQQTATRKESRTVSVRLSSYTLPITETLLKYMITKWCL